MKKLRLSKEVQWDAFSKRLREVSHRPACRTTACCGDMIAQIKADWAQEQIFQPVESFNPAIFTLFLCGTQVGSYGH